MVTKTVLAVALILLAAAAAAQWTSLQSTGPYDYNPYATVHYYLLWFPPHAVPMNLTLLNVTWFRPEAIWFKGMYPVHICEPRWCGYKPATIYVVQDGVYVRKDVRTASYHIVAGLEPRRTTSSPGSSSGTSRTGSARRASPWWPPTR